MKPDLNRPLRQVHGARHLHLRHIVAVPEVYQQTLLGSKGCQRLIGGHARDQGFDRLVAGALGLVVRHDFERGPPGAALEHAKRLVTGDLQHPAQRGLRAGAGAPASPGPGQRLLHRLLGVLVIA
jgi:hypothetical protein